VYYLLQKYYDLFVENVQIKKKGNQEMDINSQHI